MRRVLFTSLAAALAAALAADAQAGLFDLFSKKSNDKGCCQPDPCCKPKKKHSFLSFLHHKKESRCCAPAPAPPSCCKPAPAPPACCKPQPTCCQPAPHCGGSAMKSAPPAGAPKKPYEETPPPPKKSAKKK